MTTLHLSKSTSRSPLRLGLPRVQRIWIIRGFLLIPLALAWCVLSPTAQAVSPAPDGGYSNNNTAEGTNALFSLTNGGSNTAIGFTALYSNTGGGNNTAVGEGALFSNTTGNTNTGIGYEALNKNTTGYQNTATGWAALHANTFGYNNTATGNSALSSNTTGYRNTANGLGALGFNTTGIDNTANGYGALSDNTTGHDNTANGAFALLKNTTGIDNTTNGYDALYSNTTGNFNTANGFRGLYFNTAGTGNTGEGYRALLNNTGSNNIGLGSNAGSNLTTGSTNIDIGNTGVAAESATMRIGTIRNQTRTFIAGIRGIATVNANAVPVVIDSAGQLGTASSSRRFKKEIKPMDQTSQAILALKPVTFQYKSDSTGTRQFGLIAEEVARVNPDLVVRDDDGEIYTVRYDAVNAMLLNEFLKEHRAFLKEQRKVETQEATITQLRQDFQSKLAEQEKQIKVLTSGLQKVSAKLETSRPTQQMVDNHQ